MEAATMRAIVMREIGAPSILELQTVAKPTPKVGEVLIRIKAFGLNRSEVFTRQGHSLGVVFPRILRIEAAGEVEAAPGATSYVGALLEDKRSARPLWWTGPPWADPCFAHKRFSHKRVLAKQTVD
jgi:hypothetical protein